MTPIELSFRTKGLNKKMIRQHNERAWLAYHTAVLTRVKRLPDFKRLLFRDRKKRQTWQQQLQIAQTWHKVYQHKKENVRSDG